MNGQRFVTFLLVFAIDTEDSLQDRIVMGAERKSHFIDPKVKKMTAYHEVRTLLFDVNLAVLKLSFRVAMLLSLYTRTVRCLCIK